MHKGVLHGVLLLALAVCPAIAQGAGFAIIEQSVSGLGSAFADGAAGAGDASTLFFNPAGMALLERDEAILAGHVIYPRAEFDNQGSTHILQQATGVPLLGSDGGDGGEAVAVPNVYVTRRVSPDLVLGLGVNAPFGLATEYSSGWVGRYHAIRSELLTVNINPSAAYRLTDSLFVGFGVSAQYLDAELTNAIDFGTLDALDFFGLGEGALGLTPQQSDGLVELTGDNWGFGYNLGLLWQATDRSRLGIAYRSQVSHDIAGEADFTTPPQLAPVQAASGFFTDGDADAEIDLPDSLSVGAYHRFAGPWAVMADVTWTDWSQFDELRFEFANGQPDGVTTENWEDSWRYAIGVHHFVSEALTLRAGVAYDETPIPDSLHRTPRIPGEDRAWVTVGVGWKPFANFRFDAGYAHLFIDEPEVDKSSFALAEDQLRGGLKGDFDASVDIFSAQVVYLF